jgi:hypothetical protein
MPERSALPRSAFNILPLKERMKILRTHMPEADPLARSRSFEEVNLGLQTADALTEASRCIECAKPGCVVDCPVGVKIKEVVALIYAGDYLAAAAKLREDNALPAITGRVCPQEHQCEGGCVLGKKGAPVAIGNLERFVADFERTSGQLGLPPTLRPQARVSPSSAAVQPASQPRAISSKRAIASASSRRSMSSAASSSTASPSSACPSPLSKKKWTTCAAWASSSRPTSSLAKASPSTS